MSTSNPPSNPPSPLELSATAAASERAQFSRQWMLPDVGWEGQQALLRHSLRVAVTGAPGEHMALLYLASAGIGLELHPSAVQWNTILTTHDLRQYWGLEAKDVGRPYGEALQRMIAAHGDNNVSVSENIAGRVTVNQEPLSFSLAETNALSFAARIILSIAVLSKPGAVFRVEVLT